MGFAFVQMKIGEIVSSNGGLVFRKLSLETIDPDALRIDLAALGLPAGKYTITVTANATDYLESKHSNAVIYTAYKIN